MLEQIPGEEGLNIQKLLDKKIFIYYGRLQKIEKYCNLSNVILYNKINFIQAAIESALVVLLAEGFMLYSQFFSNEFKPEHLITIFVIPVILSTVVCFIFTIFITRLFINKIVDFIEQKIINSNADKINIYEDAHIYFSEVFLKIHKIGCACYAVISIIVAIIVTAYPGYKLSRWYFSILLAIMGTIFGYIWNVRGYWGDQRIDWGKIFIKLKDINLDQVNIRYKQDKECNAKRLKFLYTAKHLIINIISIILILICFVIAAIFPRGGLANVSLDFGSLVFTSYGFFVLMFITVFVFYLKTLFPLFYKDGTAIYSNINELLAKDQSRAKE